MFHVDGIEVSWNYQSGSQQHNKWRYSSAKGWAATEQISSSHRFAVR